MPDLEYTIAPDIFAAHPGYCRGIVVVSNARNDGHGAMIQAELRREEDRLRERVPAGDVASWPPVAAWREAYREFGAKVSEHRSSIEAMTRRVVRPDRLPSINPLVDIGNLVSLRYSLPAGVHPLPDSDAIIALRLAASGDVFAPADGSPVEFAPAGEVVFAQDHAILTRRWTWRQAAGTQTLRDTRAAFFNVDGLPPITRGDVESAMRDIEQLVREHTGGRVVFKTVLTADQPTVHFPIP
ncbi:MAG: phenylalanine--tRNA ligase beta subunit-related protein [Betaproteobacteria bacterium]